ncbi:carbohydrate-binding protein [Agrobacterium larrymoorei]|uniref:carbohydrate-binding protein n=1 Tax=Agrobacterium larrymoorei TaxID=160699 RepID=UPI001573A99A|nr:carbohydrate-binding protein [Agrobacterium larrymoorei]NTJ44624.1 carbohydrate-binding protein [Agrobacterium larrymoorei]
MKLTLKVVSPTNDILAQTSSEDEVFLVYRANYREGDRIILNTSEPGYIHLALDAAMPPTIAYLDGTEFTLPIPDQLKRKSYPPQAFTGYLHRLSARRARHDAFSRRNLAFNPFDHHDNESLFPHATANVETRGESAFAARNAIDGEKANDDHGFWPYTSWGINRDPNAALTVNFGRPVVIDEFAFYLRADFPHDAWWKRLNVTLSSGETLLFELSKTGAAQSFSLEPKTVEWIRLHDLKKADDPSPFPALTQIEVWGVDVIE